MMERHIERPIPTPPELGALNFGLVVRRKFESKKGAARLMCIHSVGDPSSSWWAQMIVLTERTSHAPFHRHTIEGGLWRTYQPRSALLCATADRRQSISSASTNGFGK